MKKSNNNKNKIDNKKNNNNKNTTFIHRSKLEVREIFSELGIAGCLLVLTIRLVCVVLCMSGEIGGEWVNR